MSATADLYNPTLTHPAQPETIGDGATAPTGPESDFCSYDDWYITTKGPSAE